VEAAQLFASLWSMSEPATKHLIKGRAKNDVQLCRDYYFKEMEETPRYPTEKLSALAYTHMIKR
jgi:hypothetical protein